MKYKITYLLYKLKGKLWVLFDTVAINFNIVLITFILACGLYYSIAIIWFVFLLIFVVQTWWVQKLHRSYTKKQYGRFS